MKKSFVNIFCSIPLSILLFTGCTKDEPKPEKYGMSADIEVIDHAEEWFNQQTGGHIVVEVKSSTKSSGSYSTELPMYGKWDESITEDLGRIKNVEVPVYMANDDIYGSVGNCTSCQKNGSEDGYERSRTRFVVQTDEETGETRGFMMTVIPDEEFLTTGKNIDDMDYYNRGDNFSGLIVFLHLDGTFANGWKYEDGEIVNGYIPQKVESTENRLKAMAMIEYLLCSQVKVEMGDYTYYNDVECWTSYEFVFYYESYYQFQRDRARSQFDSRNYSGGGGSSGGSSSGKESGNYLPYYDPKIDTPKTYIITNKNSLDEQQSLLLETAVDELASLCSDDYIYNQFVSNGQKFNFKMNSGLPYPAGYNPTSKTFFFKNNDAITSSKLKEEFFHAFQDFYYSGGIAQYASTGLVNIEFEAKLHTDITNVGCCVAFNMGSAPQEIKEQYENWVFAIQNNPSTVSSTDYQKWLNLFNQYTPAYSSPFNSNLSSPDALNSIITSSKCF